MVGPVILLLCANIATSHKDTRLACQKGFEAAVTHTGHDKIIKKYARAKEDEVREIIGEDVAIAALAIHSVFIKQEVSASFRGIAGSHSTVVRFTPESATININWRF